LTNTGLALVTIQDISHVASLWAYSFCAGPC